MPLKGRILGPLRENDWRLRHDNDVYHSYRKPFISLYIKLKRLQWTGHVQHMDMGCMPKRILHSELGGKRPVGKPRRRWTNAANDDSEEI
jgi:hypothetical protein